MRKLLLLLALTLSTTLPAPGQEIHWTPYQDLAVQQLQRYLQINTTNPPGNELEAARFFQEWFTAEGIPCEVYEFAPGRATLIARLPGDGSQRPLILLHHMDVVSSDPARWRVDPFSGAIVDGSIYGRGALDTKALGLLEAMVLVILKREGVPLHRDVLFVASADEEVDVRGADWLAANQRQQLAAAEYVINEGGDNLIENGRIRFFGVDTAEKAPFWLRVRAQGRPGHGSRPLRDSATNRLIRALARLVAWETPIKVLPGVEKFFHDLAGQESGERAEKFRHLQGAVQDPKFLATLTGDEMYNYMLRNTVSLTMLQGSKQTNVIPGEATAQLDVRLLPGEEPQEFLRELRAILADDTLEIEPVTASFRPANSSPADTELFHAIEAVVGKHFPGAVVTTRLLSGWTECQVFRQLGSVCYGFSPFLLTREEVATVHGDNERVSVENVRRGLRVLYEVVEQVAR